MTGSRSTAPTKRYGFEFNYHRSHLNGNNTSLAQGADAVCIFVNDTADAATIRSLAAMDVKLIALRCAGFNNVDLKAAAEYGIPSCAFPPIRRMPWRNTP